MVETPTGCAYCSTPLLDGTCPACDAPLRPTWSSSFAGALALAGVALFLVTVVALVLLAAMTARR